MPSLKELRNRIASVKATQKITKAMQMVAAAKLRRAQTAAEAARPYATRMEAVLANLATALQGREGGPPLMVGTGKDARPSARGLHRRARPLRRVQLGHRAARPRAYQSAAGRRQAGEDPLRRQEGLRSAEAALRPAHHRRHRLQGRPPALFRACREGRRQGARPVRRGRLRRGHAVLLPLPLGDQPDPHRAADHPGHHPRRNAAGRGQLLAARSTNTSPTRPRSWPSCCRSTSPCRSSRRCSRTRPPSRARA